MRHLLFSFLAILFSINTFCQCTITSLPFQENFQSYNTGYGTKPPCWVSNDIYYSIVQLSGNRYLGIYNSYMIINEFDTSIHINTLKMNLNIKGSGKIYVGIMNNNTDFSTFDTIAVLQSTLYNTFSNHEVNFSQYQGNGNYIAFKSDGTLYIDDVYIQITPACSKPFNFCGNVNSASVDLSWAEGHLGDSAWWIYYKIDTVSVFDSIRVTSNPYTITNLSPLTNYIFFVATDCGSSISLKSDTLSLITHCNTIDTLPHIENFSTYGSGFSAFPTCWFESEDPGSSQLYVYSNKLVFYYNNYAAVTPAFGSSINLKDLTVSFDIKNFTESYYPNNGMLVGVMDDEDDYSSIDTLYIIKTPYNVLKRVHLNFQDYQGNGKHIVFRATRYNISDLVIDYTPACARPYNLTSNTNSSQTELSWHYGNLYDSAWYVYYKTNSSTVYDSVYSNSSTFTLTNLLPQTNYTAFVKTYCDSTLSESTDTIVFRTYCNTINSIPFVDNFNTYGSGSTIFPTCWKQYNSDNGVQRMYVFNQSLILNRTSSVTKMAITPQFNDSISLNNLMLTFKMKANYYSTDTTYRNLIIGSMTDVEDISTFDSITTVYANSNWRNIEINLAQYDFSGQYIAFKACCDAGAVYIKNLLIDELPDCARPIYPRVNNISAKSANISWDLLSGNENSWKVYYKQASNSNYDSVITNNNSITLNNLLPSTNYKVYIVSLCDTSHSTDSDTLNFSTICITIDSLPFVETFTLSGNNTFPTCWKTSSMYIVNGNFYMNSGNYLVTPEIINSLNVSDLMIRLKSSSYSDYQNINNHIINIGIITNPNDMNTFDSIASISFNNLLLEEEISLENYNGTGRYIAFKTNDSNSFVIINDLLIDKRTSRCIRPYNFTAVQNSNNFLGVDLSWQVRDTNADGWWILYQVANSNYYDSVYSTTTAITISNLLSNTNYNFYLKTECDIEGISLITPPISYITPCYNSPISNFPFTEDFTSGFNCWIVNNNGKLRETNWLEVDGSAKYFYENDSIEDSRLISPVFNFTTNMQITYNLHKEYNANTPEKRVSFYINSTPDTIGAILLGTEFANGINGQTPYWDTINYLIPLNTFGERYIIFIGEGLGNFKIDNIVIESSPTCPSNYDPNIIELAESLIIIDWDNSILIPQNWILSYQAINSENFNPSSTSATQVLIPDTANTLITLNGLNSGTTYSLALRPLCDTNWSNIKSIQTPYISTNIPHIAQIPYICNFEDTIENRNWIISNGNAINRWYISSAVDNGTIEGNSLLISNNNGNTNEYTHNIISCVNASRQFESTGATGYTLTFDVRMKGEPYYDYLKVFILDDDTTYIGSNTIQYYGEKTFSNQVVLFGGLNGTCSTCAFINRNDSSTITNTIQLGSQGIAGNIKKLVFLWVNNNNITNNPPPAIDNISLTDNLIRTFIFDTICEGEVYTENGFNADSTGIFIQTLQSINGVDSIIYLNLKVNKTTTPNNITLNNILNYIELNWEGDEENYIIYKDNDSLTVTNVRTYQDTNVVEGVNYCYKIKAFNGECESDLSNEECKTFLNINTIETNNFNAYLYPNPTSNKTILRVEGLNEDALVRIYDHIGRLIKTLEINANDKELEIDVENFTKGVYNIRISNSTTNITKKLVVNR